MQTEVQTDKQVDGWVLHRRTEGLDSFVSSAFDGEAEGQTHPEVVTNGIAMITGLTVPSHKLEQAAAGTANR